MTETERGRPSRIVVVPGTWGREQDWHKPGSNWATYLDRALGVSLHRGDGRPFVWSGDVNGHQAWRRWLGMEPADHSDWMTGGANLYAWVVPPLAPERRIPPEETYVVCHSHGLQVVLYACALGLKIKGLISVTGPVRADMREVAKIARPEIGTWLHVHSDRSDRMQWLGEFGDGALGIVRAHSLADLNHALPKAGHSGVFHDPQWFHMWGPWLEAIR